MYVSLLDFTNNNMGIRKLLLLTYFTAKEIEVDKVIASFKNSQHMM
jgi:hypothetical protein